MKSVTFNERKRVQKYSLGKKEIDYKRDAVRKISRKKELNKIQCYAERDLFNFLRVLYGMGADEINLQSIQKIECEEARRIAHMSIVLIDMIELKKIDIDRS